MVLQKFLYPQKKRKTLKESKCNNLERDELVLDEDDMMMLHEIAVKDDLNANPSKHQQKLNQVSYNLHNENIENTLNKQNCSDPINTDKSTHVSFIENLNESYKSQNFQNSQISCSSTFPTTPLHSDKEILEKYQKTLQNSELNVNCDSSALSISNRKINDVQLIKDFDIYNVDYDRNLENSNNLISKEPNTFLEKTAQWYLKNMEKYGISQQDVTLALYKTSGVKKLAVIVMDAFSKNLPLPNIEGIWTEEDDLIAYCGSARELKQLNKKHGGKLHNRIKFLQDYLDDI